jgi:hypothetical protein
MEGDSKIILGMFSKLLNSSDPTNISPSWRLLSNLEYLKYFLLLNWTLISSHVRRNANKIAEELANIGVDKREQELGCGYSHKPEQPSLLECVRLSMQDDTSLDGVSCYS